MDRKSGLGFGFFNKSRSKLGSRKKDERSERQMADMYDKLAIRGSIQHVWGEEAKQGAVSRTMTNGPTDPRPSAMRAQTMPTAGLHQHVAPPLERRPTVGKNVVNRISVAEPADIDGDKFHPKSDIAAVPPHEIEPPVLVFQSAGVPTIAQDFSTVPIIKTPVRRYSQETTLSDNPTRTGSASGLSHKRSVDSDESPISVVHKKFSFCPSTISLVSQRSPSGGLKGPRRSSLTSSNYPYPHSRRSSLFSASTPSLPPSTSFSYTQSDNVSIAADEEEEQHFGTNQISPTNSLHYSNSILSRMSSVIGSPSTKCEDKFLPGSIYAAALPDALRGLNSVDALPVQYDEDDESSSISGLSEVNADNSDSEFDTDPEDGEGVYGESHGQSMITTAINDRIRRDSVKRVSYTKLESGEYLVAHKRRSRHSRDSSSAQESATHRDQDQHGAVRRSMSVQSDESGWSIEREYISGGI